MDSIFFTTSNIHILDDIKVAPNPTNGIIHIDFSESFTGVCKVMDITGKLIFSKSNFNGQYIEFGLSNNPGMNLIQLTSEKGDSKVFKVFVIK